MIVFLLILASVDFGQIQCRIRFDVDVTTGPCVHEEIHKAVSTVSFCVIITSSFDPFSPFPPLIRLDERTLFHVVVVVVVFSFPDAAIAAGTSACQGQQQQQWIRRDICRIQ